MLYRLRSKAMRCRGLCLGECALGDAGALPTSGLVGGLVINGLVGGLDSGESEFVIF